jgi:colanic acid/amylovoran biosynthesis glycosyltransferase
MHRYEPVVLSALKERPERFPFSRLYIPDLSKLEALFVKVDRRLFHRERLVESFFRQVTQSHTVKLLHAHFGPMGVLALPLCSELPLVITFYGKDMSVFPQKPSWLRSYRSLFQEGDLFLVEGSHMKQELAELGCPPRKIQIQRIGVDLRKLSYRPAPPIHDNVRILMCGRFVEKKGFEYGIRAFSRVVNEFPNVQLRIVGDGPLRPGVERLIRDLHVADRVVLLGYLDYDSYAREAERAHLFMAPSVTAANGDSEGGAPTVILEMEARGLPVLSTRHADIPEVVMDGVSGYLVPERDAVALATKLSWLLAHPERWNEMGKAGRSHIEDQHDIVKLAQQLEEKYDAVRLAAQ